MRTVPSALQTRLLADDVSPIILVRLTRRDSAVLRMTSWDKAVTHDGVQWDPSDGVQLSAIQAAAGSGADDLEASGFLSDSRISEQDLLAGLWDDCLVEVFLTEAQALAHRVVIFRGRLGRMQEANGEWSAELLSLLSRLSTPLTEKTSASCRCQRLGDARCAVNLAGNTVGGTSIRQTGTVSSATSLSVTLTGLSGSDGHFTGGIAKVLTGANAGQERGIKSHVGGVIGLRRAVPFALAAGVQLEVTAGCDRTIETCRAKYGNANNFQGEPGVPGNDAITKVGR
jgi:uncharacterized phage protein (TIGR02218 family)